MQSVGSNVNKYGYMRQLGLIIFIAFTIFSCSRNPKSEICFEKNNNFKIDKVKFSVIDSLKKYSDAESKLIPFKIIRTGMTVDTSATRILDKDGNPPDIYFCDTIDAFLFIGNANKTQFGLTLKDSRIALYQIINGSWIITDTTDFFNHICLKQIDLNGDGYKDLRISTLYDKQNGDVLTCAFIFNKLTNTFKLNESFGQANVEYDKKKNFVKFWIGCKKGQGGVKWKGIVVGDQLKVDSTVTFYDDHNNNIGILELYKGPNGASYKPIKTEKGNPDSIWIKFSRTFWTLNE